MKELYDKVSYKGSKYITKKYSTSFSLGIKFLDRNIHNDIYAIYGFVRLADEIVDTFHDYDKDRLIAKFRQDTVEAIEDGISLNPALHCFQMTVRKYDIEWELIDTFLKSMEMDLSDQVYDRELYEEYILGSAEVVGLMCLRVFTNGDKELYKELKPYAMSLGAAFQKVNFLRDASADYEELGRTYFPGIDLKNLTEADKMRIEAEIEKDFKHALEGIRKLPYGSRRGVYLAYLYYVKLFNKIKTVPPSRILQERIRIANGRKMTIMLNSMLRHSLNLL